MMWFEEFVALGQFVATEEVRLGSPGSMMAVPVGLALTGVLSVFQFGGD